MAKDGLGKVKNPLEIMQCFARYCVKALHVTVLHIAFLPIRRDELPCVLIGRVIVPIGLAKSRYTHARKRASVHVSNNQYYAYERPSLAHATMHWSQTEDVGSHEQGRTRTPHRSTSLAQGSVEEMPGNAHNCRPKLVRWFSLYFARARFFYHCGTISYFSSI